MKITSTLFFFFFLYNNLINAQLSEGFNGTSFPPLGWASFIGANGAGPVQNWQRTTAVADVRTGAGAAYVRYEVIGGQIAQDWLATPQLRPTAGNFTLSFYQKQGYTIDYGTLYSIRVSTTSQTNPAAYTMIAFQYETDFTTSYTYATVDLSAYIGQDIYVAFVMSQDDGDNWYIDDVAGPPLAPQCLPPSNITFSNITLSTADIAWTQNNPTSLWEIETVEAFTPPTGAGQVINFNPATYPSLDSATTYYVYMRDICGVGDTSIWTGPIAFSTLCPTVFNAPFIEDFDLPFRPNCWTESGATAWEYSVDAAYAADLANDHTGNGTNYAWMDGTYNNNGEVSRLTSPPVNISSLAIPELSFWVYSHNTDNSTINEFVAEVWNGSVWTQIFQAPNDLGGWHEVKYYLNALSPTGPVRVRFTVTGSGNASPWFNDILIDDVVIKESTDCPMPSNLAVGGITTTSANLSWLSNGSNANWELELVQAGNPVTGSGIFTSSNPYNATGLNMGTTYSFYVREVCSPGDTSDWVGPVNFTTTCGTYIAPYLQSFNQLSRPPCWTQSGFYTWRYNTFADYGAAVAGDHTGNGGNYAWMDGSFNLNGSVSTLTSPLVDISPLTTPALRYYIFSNNINNNTFNRVTVEFFDGAAWNTVQTFQGNLGANWFEVIINLGNFTITGAVQARFSVTGSSGISPWYNDILIDDVEFYDGPSCYTPTNLTANGITMSSANLAWTAGDIGSSQWEVELITLGQAFAGTGNFTTNNPMTVSSLQFGTTYLYAVREICSPGDTSNWSVPYLFTTPCPSPLAGNTINTAILITGTVFSDSGNTVNCYTNTTGFNSPDVWYKVVLEECTGILEVSLCNSNFDTYLRILDVDGVEFRSDDDRCGITGGPSALNVSVLGRDTVYIVIEGYAVATGDYHLYVEQHVADLLGDRRTNPIIVPTVPYTTTGTTDSCYTNTFAANPSDDVWYMYVAGTSDYYNFSLCGSLFNTYLYITDANGIPIASNNDDCGSQSQVGAVYLNLGDTIYVVVEGAGTAEGAYTLNITIDATPLLITDVRGKMYRLDGVNDYISIPDNAAFNPASTITIEAWVYSDNWAAQTNPIIITKGIDQEYSLWKSDDPLFDEKIAFRIGGNAANTVYSTTTVQNGRWYHITASNTGSRINLDVNGVREASILGIVPIPNGVNPVTIGAASGGSRAFNGAIDEVRIWNDARTITEIRENMHLTLKETETNLVGYYQFNSDWGVGAANAVQNATRTNHGTAQNMAAGSHVLSTAHAGGGVSNTQNVLTIGNKIFTGTNLEINFSTSPNGSVVVSHITAENSYAPPTFAALDTGYWVVNNYGTVTTGLNATALFRYNNGIVIDPLTTNYSLYKRPSRDFGAWPEIISPASAVSTLVGNNHCAFMGLGGFSQLVPVTSPSILANEFLYFNAQAIDNSKSLLTWMIDNEIDNKSFEIERSTDGFSWEYLDEVFSTNTSGYLYQYEDLNPKTGYNYYRLKRLENSGAFSYSDIRAVEFLDTQNFWVYPNPNDGVFTIEFENLQQGTLEIFDAVGKRIGLYNLTNNKEIIDISNAPSGVYTLKATVNGRAFYAKVVRG